MQLRHSLLPLIYTANWLNAQQGEPLILPMYYSYPDEEAAYQVPNQYTFARQLLVAPITQPVDPTTNSRATPFGFLLVSGLTSSPMKPMKEAHG